MTYKRRLFVGIIVALTGILVIIVAALKILIELVFIGVFIILVSILYIVFIMSFDVFRKDKVLDLESLKNHGFSVISCTSCNKNNIKEDKYCIYCGEKLVVDDE